MNQYYEKIMALKEAEEIKKIIKEWDVLSENIKTRPTNAPVILPDMLWIAKSGVGKTNLLKLMSEYLASKKNLMEFYGDVKFFEFLLDYCPPHERFTEVQRLIDEVNNAAGFRSEYKGIIYIDISEWIEHFEEPNFISVMEYLSAHSDNWLVVLGIDSAEPEQVHNLNAFLSMYLRIKTVTLSLPKTEDLFEYIEKTLLDYGLFLEQDAKDLLYDTIETIRANRYFDGFKSIKMLCHDIVYHIFSDDKIVLTSLSAAALEDFSATSDYVKRTVLNIEKSRQIGLLNRRN